MAWTEEQVCFRDNICEKSKPGTAKSWLVDWSIEDEGGRGSDTANTAVTSEAGSWVGGGSGAAWDDKEVWSSGGDTGEERIGVGLGRRKTLGESTGEETSGESTGEGTTGESSGEETSGENTGVGWTGVGLGRESFSYSILQAWHMHNRTCELSNICLVSLLTSRPGRRTPEQSRG